MSPAKFDHYSVDYQDLVDRSVRISGEGSEYFAKYKASYVARLAGPGFQGRILDYGCGIGLLSSLLKGAVPSARIDGYDISAQSIERIDRTLVSQGIFSSNISEIANDYDLAVLANVLHHVPIVDRQRTVAEIAERLTDDGRLIVFEHNPLNPLTQWAVKHCPFDDDAVLLRPGETIRYMDSAKLTVSRHDYIMFFPAMLSLCRPLEPALHWLPLGAQYVVIGEKA